MSRLWQKLADGHPVAPFVLLLLVTAPLKLGIGNVALGLLAAASIWQFGKHRYFARDWKLLLPIALFLLMALSLTWTIDLQRSLKALPRMIYLIVIPICFLIIPPFSTTQRRSILEKFGYAMAAVAVFYLSKAVIRFLLTGNRNVFFYHELVTEETNAIYVSVFFAVAFFALVTKNKLKILDKTACAILFLLILLLSSKNVIAVFALLCVVYFVRYANLGRRRLISVSGIFFGVFVLSLIAFPKITQRFRSEFEAAKENPAQIIIDGGRVNNVSVSQAWNQEKFTANDFFGGTAFRVYQFRIFTEMLAQDNILFTGYGLNASFRKIGEKADEYGLFKGDASNKGYHGKNFHNQYVQNFAEMGFFAFLLLVIMLFVSLKNAITAKDFTLISFSVLMISLFLTESFLWRQRGVTFFTAMYCLANYGTVLIATKKR
ncbi:O-antigen ligase family protein [Flavobacterium selenitireducens]|uniref:O-antigen ligase family protein n=1 Tax=Flavobacterium selenitireducens TaxID=2722704 RepID=UPI00168AF84B|nr:O-antigen ligase family protein [Flavobacterium selenitireducens]MBD3581592.1 hypothetical protein [Flavobacterium selenitireducens]